MQSSLHNMQLGHCLLLLSFSTLCGVHHCWHCLLLIQVKIAVLVQPGVLVSLCARWVSVCFTACSLSCVTP